MTCPSGSAREGESLAIVAASPAQARRRWRACSWASSGRPRGESRSPGPRDPEQPARTTSAASRRGRDPQMVFQDPYSSLDPRQTPPRRSRRCCSCTSPFRPGEPGSARGGARRAGRPGRWADRTRAAAGGIRAASARRVAIAHRAARPSRASCEEPSLERLDPGADPEPAGRACQARQQLRGDRPQVRWSTRSPLCHGDRRCCGRARAHGGRTSPIHPAPALSVPAEA